MCWTPLCVNKHTQCKKTWALLQTTGDKDDPNIVLCGMFSLNEQHGHYLTEAFRGWEIKIFDAEGRDKYVLLKYPEDFL
jgi:hypothetical protein